MTDRRGMAKLYGRDEIGLEEVGILEMEQCYNPRVRYDGLSNVHDHGLLIRDSNALTKFQWTSLFNESSERPRSNGVREDDGLVERVLPIYDHDVDVPGYRGQTRSVTGLPVEDGRDYTVREREYARHPYDNEKGLKFCHEDESPSLTPRSLSSGHRTLLQGSANEGLLEEVQYRSNDGMISGRTLSSRFSSYHRTPYSNTGGSSHPFSSEAVSPRGEYAPSLGLHTADDYVDPESRRSRNFYRKPVSEENYDDDHNDRGVAFGIDVANATLPRHHYVRYAHGDVLMEGGYSGLQSTSHPLQVEPIMDNSGGNRVAYDMVYGEVNIAPRNCYPDHRTEEIHGSLPREEQLFYERDSRDTLYDRQYLEDAQPILETRYFTISEQPNTTRKRMHVYVDQMSAKHRVFTSRGVASYNSRHLCVENERELRHANRTLHHHNEPHSRAHPQMFNIEKPIREPQESDRGDVKKRLTYPKDVSRPCGPRLPWIEETKIRIKSSPRTTHTTSSVKTFGKPKGTDFKMFKSVTLLTEPGICPSAVPDPVVSESGFNKKKKQKVTLKESGNVNVALCPRAADLDYPALKVKPIEDLPEDSEMFKKKVDEWFLKCIWHLYGNVGCHKRLKGQGNSGHLKCIICSSSNEFVQTKDVATHAFSSPKIGYRAQHLGFHQAVCVLMGWDAAVTPNRRWVCRSLPELVAWDLKEDVIIWPPVIVIHNNPEENYELGELRKVSINLEKFLRDNSFRIGIKACHEDPENPNIMVVEFFGTQPGFREAERLHNLFDKNKRGRKEIALIDAEVACCKVADDEPEAQQNPVDKLNDKQPEFNTKEHRKLIDKREDGDWPYEKIKVGQQPADTTQDCQKPDKREDDQNPVDRSNDEQLEFKTEEHGKLIDRRENDEEQLDMIKVCQQLIDMTQNGQKPDTREDEQNPVDKSNDEQTEFRTEEYRKLIDKRENDHAPLDNTIFGQQLVDTSQDGLKPMVTVQDCQEPTVMIQDGIETAVTAQDGEEIIATTQDDQKPIVMAQDGQKPIVMAKGGRKPLVKSQEGRVHIVTVQYCQEPTVMIQDGKETIVTAQDGKEIIVTAQHDQKPIVIAQDGQKPIVMAQDGQKPLVKSRDGQKYIVTAQDGQEPIVTALDGQELIITPQYDQEPVNKTEDDKESVNKTEDDSLLVNTKLVDQGQLDKTDGTLYGYLGTIEDLNKVRKIHPEIMCHHRARSKKEILASCNATI